MRNHRTQDANEQQFPALRLARLCFHFDHSRSDSNPEQPINASKSGFWLPALQSQELFGEGPDFLAGGHVENKKHAKINQQEANHNNLYSSLAGAPFVEAVEIRTDDNFGEGQEPIVAF
jgi:hypothetical protein